MMRLCYTCVLTHAASYGQAFVGNGDGHGACESCGASRRLYKATGLSLSHDVERRALAAAQTPLPAPRRHSTAHAFGWSLVLMAAALALAVGLLTRCARGESGSGLQAPARSPKPEAFELWCQQAIRRLPVYHEDQPPGGVAGRTIEKEAQLTALAAEVTKVSRRAPLPPRQWAALLFSTGWHESTFSLRIMRGDCKRWECDGGRARGAFQGHQHAFNREQWPKMHGLEHADVQVWAADQILRRHVRTCPGMGVEGIFAGYMGKRCESTKKTQERLTTFGSLRP